MKTQIISIITIFFILGLCNIALIAAGEETEGISTSEPEPEKPVISEEPAREITPITEVSPSEEPSLLEKDVGFIETAKVNFLVDFLKQLKDGPKYACRKASFFDLKFSLRSFNGKLCEVPLIAAIAELVCENVGDYNANEEVKQDSRCHLNALEALEGKEPMEVIKAEIFLIGKKLASLVLDAVCADSDKKDVLGAVCSLKQVFFPKPKGLVTVY